MTDTVGFRKFFISLTVCFSAGFAFAGELLERSIEKSASEWFESTTGMAASDFSVIPPDRRVKIKKCLNEINLRFPFSTQTSIEASCKHPTWKVFLQVKILDTSKGSSFPQKNNVIQQNSASTEISVLRLIKVLKPGDEITQEHVESIIINSKRAPARALSYLEKDEPLIAIRYLSLGQILSETDITITRSILRTIIPMMRGHIISNQDIELVRSTDPRIPVNAIEDKKLVIGLQTLRMIPLGKHLIPSDLGTPTLVKKGEIVDLIAGSDNFQLKVQLTALSDGKLGDRIKFVNPESGKIVEGTVTGRGKAQR